MQTTTNIVKRSRWDSDSDGSNSPKEKKKKKSSSKVDKISTKKSIEERSNDFQSQSISNTTQDYITSLHNNSSKSVDDHSTFVKENAAAPPSEGKLVGKVSGGSIGASKQHYPCRSVDNYEPLNYIDQGTYGMVFRARCKETNEVYALKQVKLIQDQVNKVGFPITAMREMNILLSLQHPNIIHVKEVVVGSTIDKIFMVMEYCENDLKTCMKLNRQSFSTAEIKQLMIQLLSAVEFMHKKGFLHRDLKSSNLLYSNKGVLSICDFGMARKYESPLVPYTYEVVTLWYRAPEVLLGNRLYSTPLDMWSVGCIFGEMITGEPMFPGQGDIDQINKIFRVLGAPTEELWPGSSLLPNYSKISWKHGSRSKLREMFPMTSFAGGIPLSDSGLDLLNKLLAMDPEKRLDAEKALEHPWLKTESPKATSPDKMPVFKSRHE